MPVSEGIKSGTLGTLGSSQLDSRRQLGLRASLPLWLPTFHCPLTMRHPVGIPVFEENSTTAHKKGQGSVRNGRDSTSKRRGIKAYGGQSVTTGSIIVTQCGTR